MRSIRKLRVGNNFQLPRDIDHKRRISVKRAWNEDIVGPKRARIQDGDAGDPVTEARRLVKLRSRSAANVFSKQ